MALAGGLARRGHRVAYAAVVGPGGESHPVVARARALGVEVFPLAFPLRAYLREIRELERCAHSWRADVVHTHGYRADVLGGIAARRGGVPQVTTAHGFTGGGMKNRAYEWLQQSACRRADAVIAVSRSVQDRLRRGGVRPERLHLIPNAPGILEPASREEARARLGIPSHELAIGWVGRLSPEKGVDLFIRALALLRASSWTAHVVGDGPTRRVGEGLAEALGLTGRVRWHGVVQEAGRLLTAFDLLVLSSRTEGTPIVLLEAARAEVPVVATAVGGVPDIYEPGEVHLVQPERPDAIAEAMDRIIASPEPARQEAARTGAVVCQRFDPARWLRAHEELYASIRAARLALPS